MGLPKKCLLLGKSIFNQNLLHMANEFRQESSREFGLPEAEFKPIGHGSNRWIRLTATIVGIVFVLGVSIVYWFFYRSTSERMNVASRELDIREEISDIEFIESDQETPTDSLETNDDDSDNKTEDNLFGGLAKDTPTKVTILKKAALLTATTPPKGIVTRINTLQDKYYIITGSFIDDDLATDYAEQLAKQGEPVMILEPRVNEHYFRVAVACGNTLDEAEKKTQELKVAYGNSIWVLRY